MIAVAAPAAVRLLQAGQDSTGGAASRDAAGGLAGAFAHIIAGHPVLVLRLIILVIFVGLGLLVVMAWRGREIKLWGISIGPRDRGDVSEAKQGDTVKGDARRMEAEAQPSGAAGAAGDAAEAPAGAVDHDKCGVNNRKSNQLIWASADRLFKHLDATSKHRRPRITWIEEVTAEFGVRTITKFTVLADGAPLQALAISRGSTDAPVVGFDPLKLTIRGRKGPMERHKFLPTNDEPARKRYLILFCPPLQPTEDPYPLEIDSVLPGAAKKLRTIDVPDTYALDLRGPVIGPIDELKATLTIKAEGRYHVEWPDGATAEIPDENDGRSAEWVVTSQQPRNFEISVTRRS